MSIYLDNSATTKPYEDVILEMNLCMRDFWANPSSVHELGHKAYSRLKDYRERMAGILKCKPAEVIFTSGGTEGNNMAIKGIAAVGKHIITSNIEHPSVRATVNYLKEIGCEVTVLKVGRNGKINIDQIEESIKKNTVLLSIMHMNNEVGVMQDIQGIGEYLKENHPRVRFHVDAVQSFCKHEIDLSRWNVDILTTSAHKHHGPRGVGILYIRKNIVLERSIHGSGQENGRRPGTENLQSIGGMVVSAEKMHRNMINNFEKVYRLKEYFIEGLSQMSEVSINSPLEQGYSPYVLNISLANVPSEVMVRMLSEKGVCVSKGAACSSKSESASRVLTALGMNEKLVNSAVRISFCETNTLEEIDKALKAFKECSAFLSKVKF